MYLSPVPAHKFQSYNRIEIVSGNISERRPKLDTLVVTSEEYRELKAKRLYIMANGELAKKNNKPKKQ